jgi:hypothetical protein
MLAYTLLSPSDNKRLQGTFKAFYDALLKPSDNIPSLDGFVMLFHYCMHPVLYGYPGQIDKYMLFSRPYACATPPYPKILDPVFLQRRFADLPQTKLSFCTLPLVQCRKDIQHNMILLLEDK